MDYQTFNSPQPSFGAPFSSAPAHSPQQQVPYADPQARLQQQSNPSFPYAQFPNGHGAASSAGSNGQAGGFPSSMPGMPASSTGGALMHNAAGGLSQNHLHQARAAALQQQQQQQQQHQQQQHQQHQHQPQLTSPSPYSTAPFSQGLVSPAHQQQQFVHHRQTASPSSAPNPNSAPPYAAPTAQQSPSVPSNAQQPMNPPASQPPTSQPMAAQTPVKAVPQSPVSPAAHPREKERIDTLLEINQVLIQEVMELQTQGKAGHIGPAPEVKQEGEKQLQPSMEYRDCMRRMQANLAFLAQSAERHSKPNASILPGPAIMNPPAAPDELVKLYLKLQTLFPGWKGPQAKASPGPQRLNSTSSQSSSAGMHHNMQPPNSAGLQNNMQASNNSGGLPPNMQLPSNAIANANAMSQMHGNMQ